MINPMIKRICQFLSIVYLLFWATPLWAQDWNHNLFQQMQASQAILLGKVVSVQTMGERSDLEMVTVQPQTIVKGESAASISFIREKLFQEKFSWYQKNETFVFLLDSLPNWPRFQTAAKQGAKYFLKSRDFILPANTNLAIIKNFLALGSNFNNIELQKFIQNFLQSKPPLQLEEALAQFILVKLSHGDVIDVWQEDHISFWQKFFIHPETTVQSLQMWSKIIVWQKTPTKQQFFQDLLHQTGGEKQAEVIAILTSLAAPLSFVEWHPLYLQAKPVTTKNYFLIRMPMRAQDLPDIKKFLVSQLSQEKNIENQKLLLDLIATLPQPLGEETLIQLLASQSTELKIIIFEKFVLLNSSLGVAALIPYLQASDVKLKQAAIGALMRMSNDAAGKARLKYFGTDFNFGKHQHIGG